MDRFFPRGIKTKTKDFSGCFGEERTHYRLIVSQKQLLSATVGSLQGWMVGKLTTTHYPFAEADVAAAAEDFLLKWESAQCHIPLTVFGSLLKGRNEGLAHALLFVTMFDYDPRISDTAIHLKLAESLGDVSRGR